MPSSRKKIMILFLLILTLTAGLLASGCGSKSSAAEAGKTTLTGNTSSENGQAETNPSSDGTESDDPADYLNSDNSKNNKNDNAAAKKQESAKHGESASTVPISAQPNDTSAKSNGSNSDSNHSSDDSYFDDAVFVGDSLTEGFQLHGGLTGATYYGFKNLNVKDVFTKSLVRSDNTKITVAEALKQQSFGKYYIMLGANELGWVYPEVFIQKYGELIDLIQQTNGEAVIYLQSVLPVTEEVSTTSTLYSNDRIDYYDELISALAAEKGVTYLNVREAVENGSGVLPDDAATDGVHLNKDYCLKWADYLRDHK